MEETELEDAGLGSLITGIDFTDAVKSFSRGGSQCVDEIHPEFLDVLDVVGLSWLARLCNIVWISGTVIVKVTFLSLPGAGEESLAASQNSDASGVMQFSSWLWIAGPTLPIKYACEGTVRSREVSLYAFYGSGEGL